MTMETIAELPLFSFAKEQRQARQAQAFKSGPYSPRNSERLDVLFNALESRYTLEQACIIANISRRTVYNWIRNNSTFRKQVHRCQSELMRLEDESELFKDHQYSDVLRLLKAGYSIRGALRRLLIPISTFYEHLAKDQQLRALVNDLAPKAQPGRLKAHPQLTGPFDPSFQQQISLLLKRLSQGCTFRKACKDAHLSDTVVYKWKRENKDFADQIDAVHQYDSSGVRKVGTDEAVDPNRINVGLEGHYHLYFIKAKGCDLVKIGTSKAPSRRLVGLQTGSPLKLYIDRYIVGAAIFEKATHLDLKARGLHSHGEWFHESCVPFVMDYIRLHVKQPS